MKKFLILSIFAGTNNLANADAASDKIAKYLVEQSQAQERVLNGTYIDHSVTPIWASVIWYLVIAVFLGFTAWFIFNEISEKLAAKLQRETDEPEIQLMYASCLLLLEPQKTDGEYSRLSKLYRKKFFEELMRTRLVSNRYTYSSEQPMLNAKYMQREVDILMSVIRNLPKNDKLLIKKDAYTVEQYEIIKSNLLYWKINF
jgi:hypothetical protein